MVCPPTHKHQVHCYQNHGCRCDDCRAAGARKHAHRRGGVVKCEASPCACGCGEFTWSEWLPGHNVGRQVTIRPAGMTLRRALAIANGAQPREVSR